MIEVTKTLAPQEYMVKLKNETKKLQIVPQIASTLRKNLVFWKPHEDNSTQIKGFLKRHAFLMQISYNDLET